jgi:hypothetical protein
MRMPYDVRMMSTAFLFSRWNGGLGRPLTGNYAIVPKRIELRGSRLVYTGEGKITRLDPSRMLDRFVALAEPRSRDQNILEFAKRYGPLYLCKHHGLAAYHKPLLMTFGAVGPAPLFGVDEPFKYQWCEPKLEQKDPLVLSEPLEKWRVLATRAKNLLLVANAVHLEGNAPAELWEKTDGFAGSFRKLYGPKWGYLDEPWPRLAANLEYWIVAADVSVRVDVDGRSLSVILGSNQFVISSLGLVAVQLLLAVTGSEGLASCSGCGAPYISNRPPLAGKRVGRWIARRNYCENCRDAKLPQRDAARDYRNRRARGRPHNR